MMESDRDVLAAEVHAALRQAQPSTVAAGLAGERRKLLPFAVIGGALLGGLVGSIRGELGGEDARGAMAVGFSVGAAAGIAAGWPLFGLAAKLVGDRSLRPWALLVIRTATVIPAYVVGGLAAVVAALVAGNAPGRAGDAIGSTLSVLTWGSLVILPLSLALARSRKTPLVRSTGLAGAAGEVMRGEDIDDDHQMSRVGGAIIIGLVWFVAGSLIVLAGLAYLAGAFPEQFAAAHASRGEVLGIAMLVAWIAVITASSSITFRIFFGPRRRTDASTARNGRRGRRRGR